MLCSRCSEPIHPVVALDIDGTLADYHGHFLGFAAQWLGLYPEHAARWMGYGGDQEFGSWFCDTFGVDLTTFRTIKLAYRQGGIKRWMPRQPGVTALVSMLIDQQAEVWICTTRPYTRIDNIDPDTRWWIERNVVNPIESLGGLLYGDDKYEQLYSRVWPERVVAVLDDLPEQCEAAGVLFGSGVPMQVATNYNYKVRSSITVGGLDEARQMIQQRILRWRSDHA